MDLTKVDDVKKLLASSKNAQEWNANCNFIKVANGGYPHWWFSEIIHSGFLDEVTIKW